MLIPISISLEEQISTIDSHFTAMLFPEKLCLFHRLSDRGEEPPILPCAAVAKQTLKAYSAHAPEFCGTQITQKLCGEAYSCV